MIYTFSENIAALQPSAIREILKFTADPNVISFAAGNPAPEAFPVEAVQEIARDILATDAVTALQYSVTEGYAPLRAHLKAYMSQKHGCVKQYDELIITSGAQQVMELATKALCNRGDTVICEAPSFIGSLNAFRSYGLKLRGVEMEADGMSLSALEQALQEEKRARFIYVIPNFQNPTGITTSLEKRKAILKLAKKYNVLVVEDNPYGDLRFDGEDVPAIKSLDEDGRVIYAGSFSKVLSPGLRVGYAIAAQDVIQKMVVCKQVSDVHTNIFAQMIADRFMFSCDFEGHLENNRTLYAKKAGHMVGLIEQEFCGKIAYYKPQGGLFIWCTLPEGADMLKFAKEAVQRRVALVPGNAFMMEESDTCRSVRLNYSMPTFAQMDEGMSILGELVRATF